MDDPNRYEFVALSGAERRAFESIIDRLAVDDPVYAARIRARSSDSRWYTWARRRNRRLRPDS